MEESAQCSAIIQSTSLNAPAQKEYFGRFCYKWRVRTYNVYPGLEIVFNAGSVFSAILTQQLRTRGGLGENLPRQNPRVGEGGECECVLASRLNAASCGENRY